MRTTAAVAVLALVGTSLVLATPASASTPSSPRGSGYLSASTHVRKAAVTVRVPTIACSRTSPTRGIVLGVSTTATSTSHPRPYGLALRVRATCSLGRSHYSVHYDYDGSYDSGQVRPGELLRLDLRGATGWSVTDPTSHSGFGGGSTTPADPGRLGKRVLIGARVIGHLPHGLRVVLHDATVNGKNLSSIRHQRQVQGASIHVGALHDGTFAVRVA